MLLRMKEEGERGKGVQTKHSMARRVHSPTLIDRPPSATIWTHRLTSTDNNKRKVWLRDKQTYIQTDGGRTRRHSAPWTHRWILGRALIFHMEIFFIKERKAFPRRIQQVVSNGWNEAMIVANHSSTVLLVTSLLRHRRMSISKKIVSRKIPPNEDRNIS